MLVPTTAEVHSPLIPVGWDIAGIILSIAVTAAIVATICLLICTSRPRKRKDRTRSGDHD
ncbi:hypothetical protein ACIPC2_14685 [Curtobacterium pusillum]|uniref:hypothetical protein n=1 Tax=Curtobacterium pusillum TaxID=69373 RepID=UPI003817235E